MLPIVDVQKLSEYKIDSLCWRGSVAHGTVLPDKTIDDYDLIGVALPDLDNYFGITEWGSRGTVEIKEGKWDVVLYEPIKFVRLLLKGNPNVLHLLWADDFLYVTKGTIISTLIVYRDIFKSKQYYHTVKGYAYSQLTDMNRPVSNKAFSSAERQAIFTEHGYDPKDASHTVRILKMGVEFLTTGGFTVRRDEDLDELLSIKKGEWTKEEVVNRANDLFEKLKEARDQSSLPDEPDYSAASKLITLLMKQHFFKEVLNNA